MSSTGAQIAIADDVDNELDGSEGTDSAMDSTNGQRLTAEQSVTYKIRRTHAKLNEASNTTLNAANSILDGLDRASGLLDDLDAHAALATEVDERGAELRNALRDELMSLMDVMQFQDIASQQLATASSTLSQAEERLASATRAAGGATVFIADAASVLQGAIALVFDPNATMENSAERQAAVDAQTQQAKDFIL